METPISSRHHLETPLGGASSMHSLSKCSMPGRGAPILARAEVSNKPWVVRVDTQRRLELTRRVGRRLVAMLETIEGFARAKAYCWPSTATLAAVCGCSERTVQATLRDLEARGL